LTKGSPVYVEGRLRVEEWTDRDGKTRQSLEVNATDMQFLSGGGRGEGMGSHSAPENEYSDSNSFRDVAESKTASTPTDDDIPF
jgi:single-strand DNA-binding protein